LIGSQKTKGWQVSRKKYRMYPRIELTAAALKKQIMMNTYERVEGRGGVHQKWCSGGSTVNLSFVWEGPTAHIPFTPGLNHWPDSWFTHADYALTKG
jgi:hypothetical protein